VVSQAIQHISLRLPRHCVSPRQVARAGDIWRLCQEAAVIAADNVGWSGERFIAENVGFVVARMTVIHGRELVYGQPIAAHTWLADWQRETISRREVRLEVGGEPVAQASQQWIHVGLGLKGEDLKQRRASVGLLADFSPSIGDGLGVFMPDIVDVISTMARIHHTMKFQVWHTAMDPFGHVNHPVYVDWCDELTARILSKAGVDPQNVVPVADNLRFRRALMAGEDVVVNTELQGFTSAGDAVLGHRIETVQGELAAQAVTVRRFFGDTQADWAQAFGLAL